VGVGLFIFGPAADFEFAVEVLQDLRIAEAGYQGFLRAHGMSEQSVSHKWPF
jgi:hypothetical protein